jgi:hypothetical protein
MRHSNAHALNGSAPKRRNKMREMFVTPMGSENTPERLAAEALGLKYVESCMDRGEKVGLSGNTYAVRDQIKAAGFRWHGDCKVWYVAAADAPRAFSQLQG